MKLRSTPLPLFVGALAASQLGATDCGQVTRDPGFDLWCGDMLCVWKLDHGDIRQVPTWHEGDDGVELVSDDVAIHQLTPVTSRDRPCIEFSLIADVDLGPDVRLKVDVFGDGSFELDQPIPAAKWEPIAYRFRVDGVYDGIKFWITKTGPGHATVAELSAHTFDCSEGASLVITGGPAPDGGYCQTSTDCASSVCTGFAPPFDEPKACSECTPGGAPCPTAGDVCGLDVPALYTLRPYAACVPPASKQLGELCGTNAECTTGICSFFVCSTCFGGIVDCADPGEICEVASRVPHPTDETRFYPAPLVCAPGLGQRIAGEPCAQATDCATGQCAGADRKICPDGRACATDDECPVVDGLRHGACVTIGVTGGTCQ